MPQQLKKQKTDSSEVEPSPAEAVGALRERAEAFRAEANRLESEAYLQRGFAQTPEQRVREAILKACIDSVVTALSAGPHDEDGSAPHRRHGLTQSEILAERFPPDPGAPALHSDVVDACIRSLVATGELERTRVQRYGSRDEERYRPRSLEAANARAALLEKYLR